MQPVPKLYAQNADGVSTSANTAVAILRVSAFGMVVVVFRNPYINLAVDNG
jgi:hypothetical protein